MLKKLIILLCISGLISKINARGGTFPTTTYTDKDGCEHEVTGSWENQSSYTVDTIIKCPKYPEKVGQQKIKSSGGISHGRSRLKKYSPQLEYELEFNKWYNELTELEGRIEHSSFFENSKYSEIKHTLINQLVDVRETVMSIIKELKK
jgi:hypothetical protein